MIAHDEHELALGVPANEVLNPIVDELERVPDVGIHRPLEVEDVAVEDDQAGLRGGVVQAQGLEGSAA